jgi:outer membrane protein assembly factor BamB
VSTGEPVWRHEDGTRFWEANAGAGPRATPTLAGDRVYAFGATGRLNALRLADGSSIWTRDVATDTGIEPPMWGFSSSPLVVDGVVVVAAVGKLAAYDAGSGAPRWYGPDGGDGYSSPQLVVVDGVPQLLLMSLAGAVGVSPGDGTLLWEYDWPGSTRIVQPGRTADGDLLFSRGVSTGMRRVRLARGGEGWRIEERWTSTGLKPYYSDFVVHEGHAYGFDGNLLAAIDVETGERVWKGGRYGGGQLVLLPEQDLLLVVSERGELALVRAVPGAFEEVARIAALEGKTWNHPVVVGDLLLVRNSEEMAAFRLPAAGG